MNSAYEAFSNQFLFLDHDSLISTNITKVGKENIKKLEKMLTELRIKYDFKNYLENER